MWKISFVDGGKTAEIVAEDIDFSTSSYFILIKRITTQHKTATNLVLPTTEDYDKFVTYEDIMIPVSHIHWVAKIREQEIAKPESMYRVSK